MPKLDKPHRFSRETSTVIKLYDSVAALHGSALDVLLLKHSPRVFSREIWRQRDLVVYIYTMVDQVDEVKSKIDIVEVVSSYVPLKKAGRNFSGLCPFHSEKTPSFMVSSERQAFKCFGCGEGGDVFTFLEKVEGWDFRETLEELAKRAGVKLKDFRPSGASKNKEKLIEINKLAAKFYKYILEKHKLGEPGRQYLKKRGIGESLWDKFDLGYSPAGWENVEKFLEKKGYALADIATSGLIIGRETKSAGGYYDRFRERLIFPIKDSRGTVLGFSGRLLSESAKEAKYVNSPQTPVFNKGALLFGLDLARPAIRERGEVVLVEGEFDVLSSVKVGIANVVASKGTALTDQQVAILSRLCERMIICFDTDPAGDAAARRGIEIADIAGMDVKVARLGKYKDPDEFARDNPQGYKKMLASAIDVYDYFIESANERFDARTPEGKKKIGKEIIPVLSKISDDLVRSHYISKLAKLLDLDVQLVLEAVSKKRTDIFDSVQDSSVAPAVKISREEYFLALLIFGDQVIDEIISILDVDDFANEAARSFWVWLRDIIETRQKKTKTGSLKSLLAHLPKDLSDFVDFLYLVEVSPEFSDKEMWASEAVKCAKLIKREALSRNLAQISADLAKAQSKDDQRAISRLVSKFAKVSQEVKNINI